MPANKYKGGKDKMHRVSAQLKGIRLASSSIVKASMEADDQVQTCCYMMLSRARRTVQSLPC